MDIIELFAGIGSQTQALKNIGVEHKVVAVSEIDKYAMLSYEAMHGKVNNLGDITKIESLPKSNLWTYSFPCQDISVAGHQAGIKEGTRSGLLFEVERLLKSATADGTLPKYLLLENVKNLVGKKFKADFDSWLIFLSSLGYSNYWKVLNAKDYGIPQNRERVFCVSIRGATRLDECQALTAQCAVDSQSRQELRSQAGEHTPYVFPEKQELKLRLKDMIDALVDEKYYLKESTIRSILHSNFNSRRASIRPANGIVNTLCARDYKEPQCVQVGELTGEKWDKMHDISRRVYEPNGLSPTIHCAGGGNTEPKVAIDPVVIGGLQKHQTPRTDGISPALTEAMGKGGGQTPIIVAMRGRNPDNPSDRTAGSPTIQRLEENSQGLCNTLTTVQKDNLVMENAYVARRYSEFIEDKGYVPEMFVAYNKTEIEDIAPTLTVQCSSFGGSSAVLKLETPLKVKSASERGYDEAEEGDYINTSYPNSDSKRGRVGKGVAHALCTCDKQAVVTENVRIRKLTPRECLRLMGWKDEQIDKIQAAGISSTQQYRQAGNGICVQVLEAIFKALFFNGDKNE